MNETSCKFTTPEGTTEFREGKVQKYSLPTLKDDGTWKPGEWVLPIDGIAEPDHIPCGPNRLHLMKKIHPIHAPMGIDGWVCWEAEGRTLMGQDWEKTSFQTVRLLRPVDIAKLALKGHLSEIDLWKANLLESKLGIFGFFRKFRLRLRGAIV